WSESEEKTAAQIVAKRHGSEQLHSRSAITLSQRESGGHDRAARMCFGDRLEIVRFIGMSEHPVRQRRIDGGRSDIGRDDRCFGNAALFPHELDGHFAWGQAGS